MSLVNKDAAGMRDHVTVMPLLPNKDEQRLLGFILIVFLLLTAISNFTIPLFEAPDEDDHYRFALWLAYGNGLPDLNQLVAQVGHEAWQTPLYYYLLSPVMRLANGGQPDEIAPRSAGNLAGYSIVTRIHSQAESWPYVGTSLAVHLARLITSLFGVGTILVTFGLARVIWPRAAWVAAALVAFNPQFIYMSAAISNDVPAACLAGLTMCWLVRGLHHDSIGKEWYIVLGILAGLAVMTKLSNLVLVIPIGLALLLRLKPFRQTWRRILAYSMLLLIAFVSIAGWWFLSNWLRYHDWLAWQPMLNLSVGLQRGHLLNWFEALQVSAGLLTSFWLNIGNGVPQFYLFFDVLMLAAAIGLGAWLWQQLRQHTRRVFVNVGLIAVWISLTFISLLEWMRLVRATDQGRLLYPVISGLAVLLAVGLMQIAWRKWSVAPVLVAGLFIAAALTPVLVTMPAYAQPRPLPMGEQLPNPRRIDFGAEIGLRGFSMLADRVDTPGQLMVDVYWQSVVRPSVDYVARLTLVDVDGRTPAVIDRMPFDGRYPTTSWVPDQIVHDQFVIPVAVQSEPRVVTMLLSLYPLGRGKELSTAIEAGKTIGSYVELGTVKLRSAQVFNDPPAYMTDAKFGDEIQLLGFSAPSNWQPSDSVSLSLDWRALKQPVDDYTVFVHLVDQQGRLTAQTDSPPQANQYPTSYWDAGEKVKDVHQLLLPADLKPGEYHLLIGLYRPADGQRLPARHANGEAWLDDSVQLQTYIIQ